MTKPMIRLEFVRHVHDKFDAILANTGGDLAPTPVKTPPAVAPPPMWRVMLWNDRTTGPGFVCHVLEAAFRLDRSESIRVMTEAHNGRGSLVKITTRDVAETQLVAAHALIASARSGADYIPGPPACQLRFSIEPTTLQE